MPLLALTAACGGGSPSAKSPSSASSSSTSTSPSADASSGKCQYASDGQQPAKQVKAPSSTPTATTPTQVTISTNRGDIKVTLDGDKTPCTVNSFLSLAKQGYFDNTRCHRLTTQGIYVLQCGDPSASGSGGPGYAFGDELIKDDSRLQPCRTVSTDSGPQQVCTYSAGTLAMANAGPNTNGSQFFLVYKDSPLPPAYTVFGRMSAGGLQVVSKIAADGLAGGQGDGPPKKPVVISSVK